MLCAHAARAARVLQMTDVGELKTSRAAIENGDLVKGSHLLYASIGC
jgi:hypothetical protein